MAKVGTRKEIVPPCTMGNLQWEYHVINAELSAIGTESLLVKL
jgi:hypothetical protein